jgi:type III secretion protein V
LVQLHEIPAARFSVPEATSLSDACALIASTVLPLLRRRAADFISMAETQALLDQLEQVAPAPVRQVLPKPLSLGTLAEVLRRLVEEQVSIRDLKSVLEALGQVAHAERDPLQLAEYVRTQLRRSLSHAITNGHGRLGVVLLEPSLEDVIRRLAHRGRSLPDPLSPSRSGRGAVHPSCG